jgi:hypothetical protein
LRQSVQWPNSAGVCIARPRGAMRRYLRAATVGRIPRPAQQRVKPMAKTTTSSVTAAATQCLFACKGTNKWPTKLAGPMPTAAQLNYATACGTKAGTYQWLALAMYARPIGATQAQVCSVLKGPHINVWARLPKKLTSQRKLGASKLKSYFVQVVGQGGASATPTTAA